MMTLKQEIKEAVDYIRTLTRVSPPIGIILGTGLGGLADEIEKETSISYEKIPHFPVSTVESHAGRFLFGKLGGKNVVAMQGRFHHYEGYSLGQVTFPVRVMKELGIGILVVSNAAGGLNPQFEVGDLVMITDHINFQGVNPLTGPNDESLGPRFPDMYDCYNGELRDLAERIAVQEKIPLRKGIYVGVTGPNLETAAEYRFLRVIGADLVGMSTVPEVIVARHQDTRVLGFSLVTDMGLPDALGPCTLEKIIAAADKAEPKLTALVKKTIENIVI
jgi:purine-nucleoside phosphorylase